MRKIISAARKEPGFGASSQEAPAIEIVSIAEQAKEKPVVSESWKLSWSGNVAYYAYRDIKVLSIREGYC